MAEVFPKFRAVSALTVTGLQSLADNTTWLSDSYDNSANPDFGVWIEVSLAGGASSTNTAACFIMGSHDDTVFAGPDDLNGFMFGQLTLTASTTETIFRYIDVAPPYFKVAILNTSGGALAASGSSVDVVGLRTESL